MKNVVELLKTKNTTKIIIVSEIRLVLPDIDNRKAIDIGKIASQQLLNTQTPWGEWGEGFWVRPDRAKVIERTDLSYKQSDLSFKPNGYRTLGALRLLRLYNYNNHSERFTLAWKWITSQLEGPSIQTYFFSLSEEGTDEMGRIDSIDKVDDIRHTAQALILNNEFDQYKTLLYNGIEYILKSQDNLTGGWPATKGAPIQIISTIFCIESLWRLEKEDFEDSINLKDRTITKNELIREIDQGIIFGRHWLRKVINTKEDISPNNMAALLHNLGDMLLESGDSDLVDFLINDYFTRDRIEKLEYNDVIRVLYGWSIVNKWNKRSLSYM